MARKEKGMTEFTEQPGLDKVAVMEDLHNRPQLDYGIYLRVAELLQCQKPIDQLVNDDELQFQIVHQVEELWMKLLLYTLSDVGSCVREGRGLKAVQLLNRCNSIIGLMIEQLSLLETMAPRDYQEIRLQLGSGSGQESPGFRLLLKTFRPLWECFVQSYLGGDSSRLRELYDRSFSVNEAYLVAEGLAELDERFMKFRYHHLLLIQRSIGIGARSLKGRPVEGLRDSCFRQMFPDLWHVRNEMTDEWGGTYGRVRPSLTEESA